MRLIGGEIPIIIEHPHAIPAQALALIGPWVPHTFSIQVLYQTRVDPGLSEPQGLAERVWLAKVSGR